MHPSLQISIIFFCLFLFFWHFSYLHTFLCLPFSMCTIFNNPWIPRKRFFTLPYLTAPDRLRQSSVIFIELWSLCCFYFIFVQTSSISICLQFLSDVCKPLVGPFYQPNSSHRKSRLAIVVWVRFFLSQISISPSLYPIFSLHFIFFRSCVNME